MNTQSRNKMLGMTVLLALVVAGLMLGPSVQLAFAVSSGSDQANSERDPVPARLTANAGNAVPSTRAYTIVVVADPEDVSQPGYENLSAPLLNTAKSNPARLARNVSETPTGLTPGQYPASEAITSTMWTVDGTGSVVTVPIDGGQGSAKVTNTRNVGGLLVTKIVDWKGFPPELAKSFQVCIKGPSYPLGNEVGACQTFDYNGGRLTWAPLLPGQYTVTETNPGNEWVLQGSGSPANVLAGGNLPTVSQISTHKLGGLLITKTVDWKGITPDQGKTFQICINGPSYPSGSEAGACQTVGYDGGQRTWSNLIPGSYDVIETNPGDGWTVPAKVQRVTVRTDGSQATASLTSIRILGSLVVTKMVDWKGIVPDYNKTFQICIKGPSYPLGNEAGACQSIGYKGGQLTWTNLIPGPYTVIEENPDGK